MQAFIVKNIQFASLLHTVNAYVVYVNINYNAISIK